MHKQVRLLFLIYQRSNKPRITPVSLLDLPRQLSQMQIE